MDSLETSCQGSTASSMQIVVGGDPGGLGDRKYLAQPLVLLAADFAFRHELRDKERIIDFIDMQLIGRDAYNRLVSGVHVIYVATGVDNAPVSAACDFDKKKVVDSVC